MRIFISNVKGEVRAAKGLFVGEDEAGKRIFASGNIETGDLIVMIAQLVEYGMIRIATEAMMTDQDRVPFDELLRTDPALSSMFRDLT